MWLRSDPSRGTENAPMLHIVRPDWRIQALFITESQRTRHLGGGAHIFGEENIVESAENAIYLAVRLEV